MYQHFFLLLLFFQQKVPDEELEALYIEANTYMLASHLFWALWSLIQVM